MSLSCSVTRREIPYPSDDPIFGGYYTQLQFLAADRGGVRDREVEGALLVLSPRQTQVIFCIMYDQLTVAQTGRILHLRESSVRTYLASALCKLETALEPRLSSVVIGRIEDAMSIVLG